MRGIFSALLALTLWQIVSAKVDKNGDIVLVPITARELGIQKRDAPPQVHLQNGTSLVWGGDDKADSIMVNVTLATGEKSMILSMEHFDTDLKKVSCARGLSLTFASESTFQDAIDDWEWVNFDADRTFIMIAKAGACNGTSDRQPYIISDAKYDNTTFTVNFEATAKPWDQLSASYTIDWGRTDKISKRGLFDWVDEHIVDPAKDTFEDVKDSVEDTVNDVKETVENTVDDVKEAANSILPAAEHDFDIKLDHKMDANLFSKNSSGLDLKISCQDCGTKGSLKLVGHIATNALLEPQEIWVNVIPSGVGIDLNLAISIGGSLGSQKWGQNWNLAEIAFTPWKIPKLFRVGPAVTLDAGFGLGNIEGTANIKQGISATIPDASNAKIDFKGMNGELNGWEPKVETKPMEIDAVIAGNLELYVQIGVEIGVTFLDKWGFGIGTNFRLPDFNFGFESSYDEKGVCAAGDKNYGVTVQGGIDAKLNAQGWIEKNGKDDPFFDKPLWEKNIYKFPQKCFGLNGPKVPTEGFPATTLGNSTATANSTGLATAASEASATISPSGTKDINEETMASQETSGDAVATDMPLETIASSLHSNLTASSQSSNLTASRVMSIATAPNPTRFPAVQSSNSFHLAAHTQNSANYRNYQGTASPISSPAAAPTNVAAGGTCSRYAIAVAGGDCKTFAQANGITDVQLKSLNPQIDSRCIQGFVVGRKYCVAGGPVVQGRLARYI